MKDSSPKKTSLGTQKATKVLAVDLARHCGWAISTTSCSAHPTLPLVSDCGTFDIGNHSVKRWIHLQTQIEGLLNTCKPQVVVIEENFLGRNVKTTASLNQLRGGVVLLASIRKIDVRFIDNQVAKKKLLGGTNFWNGIKYEKVTKEMMKEAVERVLCSCSKGPVDHDSSDAIALLLTYLDTPITPVPLTRKPLVKKRRTKHG